MNLKNIPTKICAVSSSILSSESLPNVADNIPTGQSLPAPSAVGPSK